MEARGQALIMAAFKAIAFGLGRNMVRAALLSGAFFLAWRATDDPETARLVASGMFDVFVIAAIVLIR